MKIKEYSNQDKLSVLSKAYITPKGIACLMEIGIGSARDIYRQFIFEHTLFENRIPTAMFVKEMHIDERRIQKYAQLGL